MIEVSDRYKSNAKLPIKTVVARLTEVNLSEDGSETPIVFEGDDELMSAKMETIGSLFGTGARRLTITVSGAHSTALVDKDFTYEIGIIDQDTGEVDWASQGIFTVNDVTVNFDAGTSEIVLYDALYYAGELPYSSDHFNFPCTVYQLMQQVAALLGVELDPSAENLPNADYMISEDLYALINSFTIRDVVFELAQSTGTTAIISGSSLQFRQWSPSDEVVDEDNLIRFKLGTRWGVANSIVISRLPQEDNESRVNQASVDINGLTQIKFANIEILDDDREALIEPLYDALIAPDDIAYDEIELKTEGHGWYEIGDIITANINGENYTLFITEILLTVAGSLNETIIAELPNFTDTNLMRAGGVTKTIFNTELKVDRQGQQIISIVERQDQTDQDVANNFSEVRQDISSVITTIQTTGGGNLIKNSVGYARNSDGTLQEWSQGGAGTVASQTSPESRTYGALSGNSISLNAGSSLTQRVLVQGNGEGMYSLSFRAKKGVLGSATVSLAGLSDRFDVALGAGDTFMWDQQALEAFSPIDSYLDVIITSSADAIDFEITDLMLTVGDVATPWQQASGEITNSQVSITEDGARFSSTTFGDGTYTHIDPLGVNIQSDQGRFSASGAETATTRLVVDSQITMPPLKCISIPSGNQAGWAFVKTS